MPDFRVLLATAVGAGMLVGYAVSGWLQRSPPDPPIAMPVPAAPEAEIAALRAALDEERGLRGALEMEIEMLRQEIVREASPRLEPPPAPAGARKPEAEGAGAAVAREGAPDPEAAAPAHGVPARDGWFDEAALVARGVDEHRVARLREHFEALQMDELYLRDDAAREGWLGKPRYHKRVQELRAESREELGDDDYDLFLYASGRNNRVLLSDVLQNSPAAAAGIEPGDILVRYDGQAIFKSRDLLSATTQGAAGSTVAVDLVRNGESLRLYVRRGPLGRGGVHGRGGPGAKRRVAAAVRAARPARRADPAGPAVPRPEALACISHRVARRDGDECRLAIGHNPMKRVGYFALQEIG
jgi:hypothetical protein